MCEVQCVLFSFSKVSFMNLGALAFGAQMFRIESSSWQIFPLMSMKGPSLSYLFIYLFIFETGFLFIALSVLEFTLQTRLASNSEIHLTHTRLFLIFFDDLWLKVYYIGYQNGYFSLFLGTICLENFIPAFYSTLFQSIFVVEQCLSLCFLYAAE